MSSPKETQFPKPQRQSKYPETSSTREDSSHLPTESFPLPLLTSSRGVYQHFKAHAGPQAPSASPPPRTPSSSPASLPQPLILTVFSLCTAPAHGLLCSLFSLSQTALATSSLPAMFHLLSLPWTLTVPAHIYNKTSPLSTVVSLYNIPSKDALAFSMPRDIPTFPESSSLFCNLPHLIMCFLKLYLGIFFWMGNFCGH